MTPIVVTAYNPARRRMQISLAVTALIILGCGIYEYAYRKAEADRSRAIEENVRLNTLVGGLRQEIAKLREQNAILDRGGQVEHLSYKEMETNVAALQDQVSSLKAEVAFYRTVAGPQESGRGLRIGGFEATPKGGISNGFHFRLILVQVQNNESPVEGELSFEVEGLLKGQQKTLSLKQITPNHQVKLPFKLKYFGTVQGDLAFPAEFVPARVSLKVLPKGKKHAEFEERIDWPFEEG